MNPIDDLPILPCEQILSYLSLEDRIKARAVSRSWRKMIDSFKVKRLCFSSDQNLLNDCEFLDSSLHVFSHESDRPAGHAFAQNFIVSSRFESFFDSFANSILSNLKHLLLCKLQLNTGSKRMFARLLNSFGRLEILGLYRTVELKPVRFYRFDHDERIDLKLNLPMLRSIWLDGCYAIKAITLDAPRLQKIKLVDNWYIPPGLNIVHGESVENLIIEDLSGIDVNKLKNLEYLSISDDEGIDSTLLASLEHLKEIHLMSRNDRSSFSQLFEQKERYGRAELKIYLHDSLLNGPSDPAIDSFFDDLDKFRGSDWTESDDDDEN